MADAELLFEVPTPLGFDVRVTHARWRLITTVKHPVMTGRDANVKTTLKQPDEIRLSRSDPDVLLFYRAEEATRWICSVVKRTGDEGFLITTYPTDAIKEGSRVWPR